MAGHRVAHATLKGPSVVKELIIGMALGLAAGGLWKMHHWNEQRKTRAFYDLLERVLHLTMFPTHDSISNQNLCKENIACVASAIALSPVSSRD
ncbi:hypothetical protein YC2023_028865 [Brassica napus]